MFAESFLYSCTILTLSSINTAFRFSRISALISLISSLLLVIRPFIPSTSSFINSIIKISGAVGSEIIGTIERIKSAIVTSKAKLEISIESVTEKQQSTNQSLTEQQPEQQRYQAPTRPRFR
uniref:Uncharacterized protein n=1 Tax=Actinobacillus porcitonsillarum TaxID=189834 RepID=Q4W2T5_9PAST|nr:hypothetical protein [Actinobacillus porcitonsillarum]CAI29794.1 hypothetical protein [Actinobacillus porcitonsillarum]